MITSQRAAIDFKFPFPRDLSPDIEQAQLHSVDWAREMGLATSDSAIRRLQAWNWGRLTGHCLPTARGADLDLATDWMTWGFLYDDQFAGPLGNQPGQVLRITENMIDALYAATPADQENACTRGITDVLQRLSTKMSPSWMARFRNDLKWFFIGVLRMTTFRNRLEQLDTRTAFDVRRLDVGMSAVVDLIEVAEGFEVPEAIFGTSQIQDLRQCVIDIVILQNDVFSLPKDRRQQEVNVVLAMERSENRTPEQALERIAAMVDEKVQYFLDVKASMPSLYDALDMSAEDRARLDRYIHCLELMIHGSVYSHAECIRYSAKTEHTQPIAGQGFIQELHLDASINLAHELMPTARVQTER
ncbi:terpene synthase family protein [Melittangium boletus]|uniref:Terpene synthase n=1 Tax=Melittangium boletus DSM 14713 TaxID=1294270 RepID=A0A250IBE0_9BACT|nr:terpene synthase [Melittangium boletus]ATB28276.1 terpene cyclase [Melittangium boletus DSM 14713]